MEEDKHSEEKEYYLETTQVRPISHHEIRNLKLSTCTCLYTNRSNDLSKGVPDCSLV